jgi:hypothetical protein
MKSVDNKSIDNTTVDEQHVYKKNIDKLLTTVVLIGISSSVHASDYKPAFISKPSDWVHHQDRTTWIDQKKEGTRGITDSLDSATHTLVRRIVDFKIIKFITFKQGSVNTVCKDSTGRILKTTDSTVAPANVVQAVKQAEDAIKTFAKAPSAKNKEAAQVALDHAGDLMEVNQVF